MKNKIELRRLLPEGSRVLCAVSGGADSVCMLHMLLEKKEELGIEVFAAHYEHGLRGGESLRDAHFVKALCDSLGVPCLTEHGRVAEYAAEKKMSTEEAARELRYAFLQRGAEHFACDRIATAHNADDNAETIIFNLSRGSGAAGLRGIPPERGMIVRPILDMTRREIEEYLKGRGLRYVNDSSNQLDDYSRNLIRHHVTPVLRRINPDFAGAFASAGALLREDEDFLGKLADDFIEKHFDGESISQQELLKLHRAVSSRVLRKLCKKSLGREHIESIFDLLGGSEYKELSLPGEKIRCEQGRIYFDVCDSASVGEYVIAPGERVYISEAGLYIRAEIAENCKEVNGLFKTYCFKYESICGNVRCTSRKAGDRYRPLGRNCSKTLKSLFMEAKMTRRQRELTPVLRDDKGILAVYPFPQAERTAARKGDKAIIITIENTGENR